MSRADPLPPVDCMVSFSDAFAGHLDGYACNSSAGHDLWRLVQELVGRKATTLTVCLCGKNHHGIHSVDAVPLKSQANTAVEETLWAFRAMREEARVASADKTDDEGSPSKKQKEEQKEDVDAPTRLVSALLRDRRCCIVSLSQGDNNESNEDAFTPFAWAQRELFTRCVQEGIPVLFLLFKSATSTRLSKAFVDGWKKLPLCESNVLFGITGRDGDATAEYKAKLTFDLADHIYFIGTETRDEYMYRHDKQGVPQRDASGELINTTGYRHLTELRARKATGALAGVVASLA